MFNNILIEYLFLINLIKSEIILNDKLFYSLQGIYNKILIKELFYCENQIKDFIQFYTNFNSNYDYNNNFDLYIQIQDLELNKNLYKDNFSFNNEIFFIKNISLLNEKLYTLNELLEKKNKYKFENNIILRNLNKKYYLNFFKYNYFNFTKIINFIFNIDLLKILENNNNINISKNLNLIDLNSYKNINKNFIHKFNPIKFNNKSIYLKFYKNLNYFDHLNLDHNNSNLIKNHFTIINNLYTTEYNFKILLNFFKSDNYKEFYLRLPINYITSNVCGNLIKSCYKNTPSIDHYLSNLLYDKVIYNQNGKDIKESLLLIKKRINYSTPLIFNYKFKNKFNYFFNKKYNIPIKELKNYNLDYFNVSKSKKMMEENLDLNYFYYVNSNIRIEVSRASSIIKYYLPRIRPFILRNNPKRQYLYDNNIALLADFNSDITNVNHLFLYNHYLYGFFRGGVSSLINFTQIDMFHNNCDMFFFKGDTYNKQHHHISILNKTYLVRKPPKKNFLGFFWEPDYSKSNYLRTNLIYEKTKYERALNLMFNFNEELKLNNTLTEYICNLLFGFIKDNNETYITFKDHYNKNNFIGKHILYRINNLTYNKNIKYNIFYRNYVDILSPRSWQKPFSFDRIRSKQLPRYLHTKKRTVYPNYTVWPIIEDSLIRRYLSKGYTLDFRQGLNFHKFFSDDYLVPYSRFLKTNKISQSIYNNYYNFIPFLYYINKFDFIKKSIYYDKRHDFISFIPKFKIFNFKFLDSIQNLKYFEKLNSILIKFNNNLYSNNNQKLDQSVYNLNNLNNNILNYMPNKFYDNYPTLDWNNKLFFNIINRKLFYKHLITFGDLSNNFVQNIIYNYIKTIFFEEKLKNIFFNRNIFKYKNFENLNDFIKFKINNFVIKNENVCLNNNKYLNFLEDYQNLIKILTGPYLHMKKHHNIFYANETMNKIFNLYKVYYSWYQVFLKDHLKYYNNDKQNVIDIYNLLCELRNKDHIKVETNPFKDFDEFIDFIIYQYFINLSYLRHRNFDSPVLKPDGIPYKYIYRNFDWIWFYLLFRNPQLYCPKYCTGYPWILAPISIPCCLPDEYKTSDIYSMDFFYLKEKLLNPIREKFVFFKLHFFTRRRLTDIHYDRFNPRLNINHMNNYSFFLYLIPSKYLNYITKNKTTSDLIFIEKLFSLLLVSNLKILYYFQKIDNFYNLDKNFNFFKFFKSEIKIKDINLIKRNSVTNYKLYKNKLIEEAGSYNLDILKKNNKQDEDSFLLYNRKRLDNESIYKSWHSTKFLNKKIEYYSETNDFFNFEKKINNLFKLSFINNIISIKRLSDLYNNNYLSNYIYNFFSTDSTYNNLALHKRGANFFIRNINFIYPQNNIKNVKVFSFFTYLKEKFSFLGSSSQLVSGSFKNYYFNKRIDKDNEYNTTIGCEGRRFGVHKYGALNHIKFVQSYIHSLKRHAYYGNDDYYEESTFFKIDSFNTDNMMSLKRLTKKKQFHNINRYLSYFQYYGDTRYPKNKKNLKKLNFIFNIYNFQSYFINDRYSFENKNLIALKQFYNHRTTSDYLRNLINYKKKEIAKSFCTSTNNRSDIKYTSRYRRLYNLYSPVKLWEIKLSNKLFPYFYSKNLNFNYKLTQHVYLNKVYDNIHLKRSNSIFRKKNKIKILEHFRYFKYDILFSKYLNFEEEKNYFSFFYNNFFKNTKRDNQLKKKFYINSISNLINNEYLYDNYISKKKLLLKNEKYINTFNFKINNSKDLYSYIYNINPILPNHLNYRLLFDLYNYDETIMISKSIKLFNYCIKNNFYVKMPYISEFYTKSIYDFFSEKKINFFKLRTFMMMPNLTMFFFKKPYFTRKAHGDYLIDALNTNICFKNYKYDELNLKLKLKFFTHIFDFYKLNIQKFSLFCKTIHNKNFNNQLYISLYKGRFKYLNNNFKLFHNNNNYFFFNKTFEFNKYILLKKRYKIYYPFFNPYDFYIFRYKSSFTSLNNVLYKTNSSLNLRIFINNFYKFGEFRSKSFNFIYDLLDKDLWPTFDINILDDWDFRRTEKEPKYYSYIFKFNNIFKRSSFTLKYYENISFFNKKKIEELSFFGFLLKNNIIIGIFEHNNLCNLSYNFKYEKFYINNNEANIYSIKKVLNTIFILKNKYIWLIFFYYNNFFYFLFNVRKLLQDFLLEPISFWSYYFYFKIPIIFSVDYNILLIDISLTFYTILIQTLITFYNWFCISGEGLINLKDYIVLNHNDLDWNLLYEKYNLYPCDLYGRSLFEMQLSRIVYILFYISYLIIYIKIIFLFIYILNKFYNLFLLNLKRKKKYLFINNKFDLEINNKIHFYYLNYNKFLNNFINSKNKFEIVFFFKSKHSYKYYKSKFKCKLKLPYFLDEPSLRRINKMKILTNFEMHYFILDPDLKKIRTTLSFLNSSYALFTKTRTIEIGNLIIKGNIKRILYIHQLSNLITYDPILGRTLMPNSMNNIEKKNIYFIDKIFLNNQLKIFNLMPLSEEENYIYIPKFIFKNLIKYKFKYINVYYTYNFLFFFTFDSLLTIEGTLFRISSPNFFKPLIFFNQNISLRYFSFFI